MECKMMTRFLLLCATAAAAYGQSGNVMIVNPTSQPVPVAIVSSAATGTTLLNLPKLRDAAVTFNQANAAGGEGTIQAFSNSTTTVRGAIVSGGGANRVLAYYNGTNWT